MSSSEVQPGSGTWRTESSMILRSCGRCRQRKVKCDRAHPRCSNCTLAEVECAYPPGRGRAPKRPRTVPDNQLRERLSRLEDIIRQVTAPITPESSEGASLDGSLGRLMINETSSYYVSNVVWSNLASEVEELRDLLLDPVTDDETEQVVGPPDVLAVRSQAFSRDESNAAIFGYRAVAQSLQGYHPSLPQAVVLFNVFTENVAPMVHIFHMPSLIRVYWDAMASLESVDKDTEVLLFAIHYAAIISLDTAQCLNNFNETRETVSNRYRFATEQALARADLLNTQSIRVLQASVVFLTALRNQDESRITWSLTSLIYHVAQAMGIHRDGEAFGLKPFETELRRRLWWNIGILDNRSSGYHGYEPIVQASAFDTKPPLHINDVDLLPEMENPPPERWDEATDMSFTLIRCEALKFGWKLRARNKPAPDNKEARTESQESWDTQLNDLTSMLQDKFVQYCENSVSPFHRFVSAPVARLITAHFWLIMHYPSVSSGVNRGTTKDELSQSSESSRESGDQSTAIRAEPSGSSIRERLFLTSIDILELSAHFLAAPQSSQWAWYSKTHIQWTAVAFVLSELCTRPPSADNDRAWALVNIVYKAWQMRQHNGRGTFSLPIQRLMAKARCVREKSRPNNIAARMDNTGQPQSLDQFLSTKWVDSASRLSSVAASEGLVPLHSQQVVPPDLEVSFAVADASWLIGNHEEDQMLGVLTPEPFDAFVEFMPNNFESTNLSAFSGIISSSPKFSNDFPPTGNPTQGGGWNT